MVHLPLALCPACTPSPSRPWRPSYPRLSSGDAQDTVAQRWPQVLPTLNPDHPRPAVSCASLTACSPRSLPGPACLSHTLWHFQKRSFQWPRGQSGGTGCGRGGEGSQLSLAPGGSSFCHPCGSPGDSGPSGDGLRGPKTCVHGTHSLAPRSQGPVPPRTAPRACSRRPLRQPSSGCFGPHGEPGTLATTHRVAE